MEYLIVDDENRAQNLLKILLERLDFVTEKDHIHLFDSGRTVLDYLSSHTADIMFLDIEMPVMNGIDLAKKISETVINPPEIIFITAFPQYALKAWELNAFGYIIKPYDPNQIRQVLERVLKYLGKFTENKTGNSGQDSAQTESHPRIAPHALQIHCFPDFEVLFHDKPLSFRSRKAQELLAFLVHNRGNWVSIDKITFALLENCEENSSKNYSRTILYRLKKTLEKIGCEDIVESAYGKLRVNPQYFSCDYYEYLNGNYDLFQGDYMGEYSWAETTRALMWTRVLKQIK